MVINSILIGPMRSPRNWRLIAVAGLFYFLVFSVTQVSCDDDNGQNKTIDFPVLSAIDDSDVESLSVDAENKTILESIYDQIIRKFLKRRPRQDDGDDDGDDEDGAGGAGGAAGAVQNPGLAAISMIPALIPQIVNSLTQLGGAVNQGLNGTDTPNIPSFLIRHVPEALKFFQSVANSQMGGGGLGVGAGVGALTSRLPGQYLAQRFTGVLPGPSVITGARPHAGPPLSGGLPSFLNQLPGGYPGGLDPLPGAAAGLPADLTPEDYAVEDVQQPPQPTIAAAAATRQSTTEASRLGGGGFSNLLKEAGRFQTSSERPPPAPPANVAPKVEQEQRPAGTSLSSIYKDFLARPQDFARNSTNTQQNNHEGFSNELFHGITNAIFNRHQTDQQALLTNKPSSSAAIIRQDYTTPSPPTAPTVAEVKPTPFTEIVEPVYAKPSANRINPQYPPPSFEINRPYYPPAKIVNQIYLHPPQHHITKPVYSPPPTYNTNKIVPESTSAPTTSEVPFTFKIRQVSTFPPTTPLPAVVEEYEPPPSPRPRPVKLPLYTDFSPKPIYWMNMYYPNGIPVLTRVTESNPTVESTTPKRRRRRTRSTTTTAAPDVEYYEDDDDGGRKMHKKRRPTSKMNDTDF